MKSFLRASVQTQKTTMANPRALTGGDSTGGGGRPPALEIDGRDHSGILDAF